MNNEDVWCGRNHSSLVQVYFSVAAIALIITDDFTFNLFLKRLLDGFNSLDRQRQVKVVLHAIFDFPAFRADHLTAQFAAEDSVDQMLSARGL